MFLLGIKLKSILQNHQWAVQVHTSPFSRSPFNSDSCVSQGWAIVGEQLSDSLSLGTKLIIWGGLWFLLKSFHARMIHALPAALHVNTDTAVASLFAGSGLYLSYCKRFLNTGASVVYFSWILSREQKRKNKGFFIIFLLTFFTFSLQIWDLSWSHAYKYLFSAYYRDSLWIMTHLSVYACCHHKKNILNLTQYDAYFVTVS